MSKKRAFVRYTKSGKIVPGSLITTQGDWPTGGTYKEVPIDLCCDFDPRIVLKVTSNFSNKPYDGNDLASPNNYPSIVSGVLPQDIGKIDIILNNNPLQFGPRFVSINIGNHIGIIPNDAYILTGELSYKYKYDPLAISGYANITP